MSEYSIGETPAQKYIECHTCWRRSYNQNDILFKYCGYCNKFHDQNHPPEMVLRFVKKPVDVEVMHYSTTDDQKEIIAWLGASFNGIENDLIVMNTLEGGTAHAGPGDWIIKDYFSSQGRYFFWPVKTDYLKEFYNFYFDFAIPDKHWAIIKYLYE